MAEVTEVDIGYGAISFRNHVEAVPPSSETKGSVTVKNMGSPGAPAHFEVNFMLSCHLKEDDLPLTNIFYWKTIIPTKEIGSPYNDVEARAARQVVSELRSAADHLEKLVDQSDKAAAAKKENVES